MSHSPKLDNHFLIRKEHYDPLKLHTKEGDIGTQRRIIHYHVVQHAQAISNV